MAEDLSDAQWCVLDLLMRAKQRGVSRINRHEMLNSENLPKIAAARLVFAALTMPSAFVTLHGQHDFEITAAGAAMFNLRFGNGSNPQPTDMADAVIYLPDNSRGRLDG